MNMIIYFCYVASYDHGVDLIQFLEEFVIKTLYLLSKTTEIRKKATNVNIKKTRYVYDYHRVWNKSNTTGVTSGTGSAILPEHLNAPPVFGGARIAQSLDFFVVFCISLFVFLCFLGTLYFPSIYVFWLPLWQFQTFLDNNQMLGDISIIDKSCYILHPNWIKVLLYFLNSVLYKTEGQLSPNISNILRYLQSYWGPLVYLPLYDF